MTTSQSEASRLGAAGGDLLSVALALVAVGVPVFPLRPRSKIPWAGSRGFKDATTDPALVRGWWNGRPDANIGVPLGEASGLVAVDIDPRHGGDKTLVALLAGEKLPLTRVMATAGPDSGCQYIYRLNGAAVRTCGIGAGLEIRADGAYTVWPPSVHPDTGRARWFVNDEPFAGFPEQLLELKRTKASTRPKRMPPVIEDGDWHRAIVSAAGILLRKGFAEDAAVAALVAEHHAKYAGADSRDPEAEIRERVEDVYRRYAPDDPDNRTNGRNPIADAGSGCPVTEWTEPGQPPVLAHEPAILDVFAADLRRRGVAGEDRLGRLIYLALTSRLLPWGRSTNRPVSLLIRGTTSTGKSWVLAVTAEFFPEGTIVDLGSMSRRFLFYDEDSYSHRVLLIPEAAQVIDDDELLALLRTLLSEGRVVHGTVSGEGKPTARRIVKEGPTALITSTTRTHLDDELETRMLSVRTDDSPDQTRRVFEIHADLEEGGSDNFDFAGWHDLQRWLAQAENRVHVPYMRPLAQLMPVGATRLRRDFVSLLCLVRAHALLHQQTRERDATGRIVADISDYRTVRGLVGDVIAESVEAGVSPAIRETVEAARSLIAGGREHVTPKQLESELGVGRTATYDRVRRALQGGWLSNVAAKDERGMRIVTGTPLPGDDEYLPTVDAVVRLSSATDPDNANPHG